jgi:non-ribosomal peptide synthetase component F
VEEVNTRMLGAMAHGYVALQDVTQALRQQQQVEAASAATAARPEGSSCVGLAAAGATPFRVMFAAQNDNLEGCIQPDLGISKLDLTLSFLGTELHWEFREGLLEAGSVERLAEQYLHLLQAMVSNPRAPICSLPLLPEAQVGQLLQFGLGPSRPEYSQQSLLPAAVAARAAAAPGAMAIVCDASGGRPVSYGELQAATTGLAAELLAKPALGEKGGWLRGSSRQGDITMWLWELVHPHASVGDKPPNKQT